MDHLNNTRLSNNQSAYANVFTHNVLPALYVVIWVIGVTLNGMAAWIFFRVPSDSGLVVYLKNMVVADLLMLASFPFKVAAELDVGGWWLHMVVCRYTAVIFYFSMYLGMVFIGLISLERYVKVVRHTSSTSCSSMFGRSSSQHLLQSVGFAQLLALLTWGLLLLAVLPNTLLTSRPASADTVRKCMQLKTPLGVQWHKMSSLLCATLFWVTLLVMAFCYASIARQVYLSYLRVRQDGSHARRKSNRSIFSILAVFFICFVPYHVCRVPYTLSQMPDSDFSKEVRFLLLQVKEGTLFLSALNVCLDPIIYFLMCRTFRESLLRKLPGGERRRSLSNTQSLSHI
ncbi:P2Y purinoceptor 14 [Genypterus blacodes]|uniref:P2Y purinoceptor 14 n=1 Tax=Genypterus blacodes TaxID=154954 RepID=UPI003F772A02